MGWNSTVVVLHDALEQIRKDQDFGKNLAAAITRGSVREHYRDSDFDVPALNHCNAAYVVESHHADVMRVVVVGGNMGYVLGSTYGSAITNEDKINLIRQVADSLGYNLSKKPVRK